MNTVFSARLSALRQERGLTQKEAAAALGISAALLSHYEKGIRECGLAFLGRAAAFYEVSCDYLLGVGEGDASKEGADIRDITPDQKQFIGTLLRAVSALHGSLPSEAAAQDALLDYFTLSVYRAVLKTVETGVFSEVDSTFPLPAAESLSAAVLDSLVATRLCPRAPGARSTADTPFCIQAVVTRAEMLLQREFAAMLGHDREEQDT